MKTFLLPLLRPFSLTAAVLLALANPAHAQAPALVVDQAATLPSLATPGQDIIYDMAEYTDAQGNTYQAGTFTGAVHFGPFAFTSPDAEVVVAKRNAAGAYQWATTGGGAGEQRCKALAVDAAGNVFVTGSFDSPTAQFGATTLANARAAGTNTSDVFVAKVTAAGVWEWAAGAGGGTRINGDDEAVDIFGNAYVAGTYTSSAAFFGSAIQLATTDPAGGGRKPGHRLPVDHQRCARYHLHRECIGERGDELLPAASHVRRARDAELRGHPGRKLHEREPRLFAPRLPLWVALREVRKIEESRQNDARHAERSAAFRVGN